MRKCIECDRLPHRDHWPLPTPLNVYPAMHLHPPRRATAVCNHPFSLFLAQKNPQPPLAHPPSYPRPQIRHGSSFRFRAPQTPGPDRGLRFLAFGDMGESEHRAAKSPGGTETSDRLADEVDAGADLIYHIGDLSYANGRKEVRLGRRGGERRG